MLARLRRTPQVRRWVRWVVLLLVLLISYVVAVSLLPHHVLASFQTLEEQSNGVLQQPKGGGAGSP